MRSRCPGWLPLLCALVPCLTVLSCSSAPPPAPSPPRTQELVVWEISPAEGFRDERSYVTLEYCPPQRLRQSAEAQRGQVPVGGRLTVHLGYRSLADANTIWFRFEAAEGSRDLCRVKGEEGIPNVKGLDGYWWNDVELDLPEPVGSEARVVIHNAKYDLDYVFIVRRRVSCGP